jgi:ribosomal protein S27E
VHRGRFGGNARKRKAKLTDATFHAMIGTSTSPAESQIAMFSQETSVLEVVISDDEVQDEVTLYETTIMPSQRIEHRQFACQEYEFGYTACKNCRNEQAYYVHQADLVSGYTFRCRVCRLEMTVWAKS